MFSNQLLRSLPKKMISDCSNLTSLNLSYNHLQDLHEESVSNVSNLDTLDLSHNEVNPTLRPLSLLPTRSWSLLESSTLWTIQTSS